jgi:prepilin-type N-terminal cleavage/methylation domain-containing protein
MHPKPTTSNQAGFSLIEMIIAISVMVIITGGVMSLMKSSMMVATASYEMTDAQENLRTAQEFVNRDLMNSGDGLKSMTVIRLPKTFIETYLALNPIVDPIDTSPGGAVNNMPAGIINFGILTSDNNVTPGTVVTKAVPAVTVRTLADGTGTDRQTILEIDRQFTEIPINPGVANSGSINAAGTLATLPAGTTMSQFQVGEIYFFSSTVGGTFATVTAVDTANRQLGFAVGGADTDYALNRATDNNLQAISNSGVLPVSLQRMQIIHYYVNSNSLLVRRVFGVQGATFRDSIIAEHVLNVQFKYSLETTDAAGNVLQPTANLANKAQRLGVRQVEVTISVETPHALQNNVTSKLFMTTSTSVRNMQFRRALQPTSN